MAIGFLLVALVALVFPETSRWISLSSINYLIMAIMFGMGLTLKTRDFLLVFSRPKEIFIGTIAQFLLMPLISYALARGFHLEEALFIGFIIVGVCPGGTASNVMTYLARGDVALSVTITSVNTLLAPILTPALAFFLLRKTVDVPFLTMFFSVLNMVLVPVLAGLLINHFLGKRLDKLIRFFPWISIIATGMIIASVVSHNTDNIFLYGKTVFIVVILQNILGFLSGWIVAKIFRFSPPKSRALTIEIGMQNSGLATVLAGNSFPNLGMATVPGALFSVWHNIAGAILAGLFRRFGKADRQEEKK